MENKILKNLIPALLTLAIVLIGFAAAYFTLQSIATEQKTSPVASQNSKGFEVDKKAFDTISNTDTSSVTISLDESGFGRENPFAPYK